MPPGQRRPPVDVLDTVHTAVTQSELRLARARQHIADSRALMGHIGESDAAVAGSGHVTASDLTRLNPTWHRARVILVVDDDPDVREAFTSALASGGFHAVAAESAEHAWALLQDGLTPDAVLLDLWMPGLGGLGLLLEFRAHPLYARLPATIVTADCHIDETMKSAAGALGANVRFKPLGVGDILSLARRMVAPASAGSV